MKHKITSIEIGLWVLAFGAPLALGSVHTSVILFFSFFSLVLFSVFLRRLQLKKRKLEIPFWAWLLILLFFWSLLQTIPLPIALIGILSSSTKEILEVAYGAYTLPAWHPISLTPAETRLEALKIGVYVIVFLIAHNHLHRESRRRRLLWGFFLLGLSLTLFGILGSMFAPGKPLLFYQPSTIKNALGVITTSFVNPNHGAAFLSICTLVALSLAISTDVIKERFVFIIGAIFIGVGVLLTLSRGGLLSLSFALVIIYYLALRRNELKFSPQIILIPIILIAFIGLSFWFNSKPVKDTFGQMLPQGQNFAKLNLIPSGLAMLKAYPIVGVGKGAFHSVFPHYLKEGVSPGIQFSHLENEYIHFPIEVGLPIALIVILGSIYAWIRWRYSSKVGASTLAALAILPMVALHNVVDFSFEIFGIVLPLVIFAGILSSSTPLKKSLKRYRYLRRSVVYIIPILSFVMLIWSLFTLPIKVSNAELNNIASKMSEKEIKRNLYTLIEKAPAICQTHLRGAQLLSEKNNPEAVRWLNGALFLCPQDDRAHLKAAYLLLRSKKVDQAASECRLAYKTSWPANHAKILSWCFTWATDKTILKMMPKDSYLLDRAIRHLLDHKKYEYAVRVSLFGREQYPWSKELSEDLLRSLVLANQFEQAMKFGPTALKISSSSESYYFLSQAYSSLSNYRKSYDLLENARRQYPKNKKILAQLIQTLIKLDRKSKALEIAKELMGLADTLDWRIHAHRLLAYAYRINGRNHRAKYEMEQAEALKKYRK